MSDASSLAGVITDALSFALSGVAAWMAWRAHRETLSVQRRMAEIEEQREQDRRLSASQASLRPELRKTGSGSDRLYLVNSGMAEARNISVTLNGVPLSEHEAAVQGDDMPTHVGPNSEVSCLLALTHGCSPPFAIEVRWDDDSGAGRVYRGTLTF
jgi:hypothetical protein